MKKIYFLLFFVIGLLGDLRAQDYSVKLMDQVVFYGGYANNIDNPAPVPAGVRRIDYVTYTAQLTDNMLNNFGNTLVMDFTLEPLCDNYDRIAYISLAFVPKGTVDYDPAAVEHIEMGRFITPFMNKNFPPTEVPFQFRIDNIAEIVTDANMRSQYDFYVETRIFGTTGAGQQQVSGCSGRKDTFMGTLELTSGNDNTNVYNDDLVIIPLAYREKLNNYEAGASDVQDETTKIIDFTLEDDVDNAKFFIISSNHGANQNGEEYNRRRHDVYLDNQLIYDYRPGGESCEPFRQYNTQPNGIYGSSPRTDAQWASFSNWCPGDVIPLREIDLGSLTAGDYTFKIDVPDAQFVGNEGNIPFSLYFQNRSSNTLGLESEQLVESRLSIYPNPTKGIVNISTQGQVESVQVFDISGKKVLEKKDSKVFNLSSLRNGFYIVNIKLINGISENIKIIKQ